MLKKLILAAAASVGSLALAAPALADNDHRGHRGHHFKQHHRHHHHFDHRPVVVMPPPRVYYAPPPVYYAPPAPVYYAPPPVVYHPAPVYGAVPESSVSIRLHFPL
jgi:hypothetical protein